MRTFAVVLAAVTLLAVAVGQLPPTPTPTDPLALTGGLISETTAESCDSIFIGDPESTGTQHTLNCNKATVLILQVPLTVDGTQGSGVTFDFTPNGQSGGGTYHTPPAECAKGPGYCLYGQPFRVNIQVSPVATAYDLDLMHIVSPFAYMYENCLSLAPATYNTFYPYYAEGTCGPADIWNLDDYHDCNSKESWPWFYHGNDPTSQPQYATNYSVCAFMCGWELERVVNTLLCPTCEFPEMTLADWCNMEGNVHDTITDYNSATVNTLACDRATNWKDAVRELLPNFPQPSGICPCVNSATTMSVSPGTSSGQQSTQDLGPFSSIVACKSCAGAGSCGSALPRPQPSSPDMCTDTDDARDTVCECVPGDGNSDGSFTPEDDPVNDPNTVCFNTNQRHRCLKCQPSMVDEGKHEDYKDEYCAYTDINQYAFCLSYWEDICGAGDYTLADRQRDTSDNGERTAASLGFCNCKSNFIERAYWVAPFCAPYRIVNPSALQYVITVELRYGGDPDSPQYDQPVPNGTMSVGAGFSPFVDPGDPPTAGSVMAFLNATIDGFALTEVISEYIQAGGTTTALPGAIVMCNNGVEQPFCGFTTLNVDTNVTANPDNVPNANILAANATGLINPWPQIQNAVCASVPLPDFIYNNTGFSGNLEENQATWWYYLSQDEIDTFGLGCGQNGWTLTGTADTASSQTMCQNLQGTCVPGIDEHFRGEAIKPPCSVAVDFLDYVNEWMKRTGDSSEEIDRKNNPPQPPHVPPTWSVQQATYSVNRGKLMRYDDPVVIGGYAAVELRLSLAADFGGTTVAQAGGTAVSTTCSITTQDGLGLYNILATNKGQMAAEYSFRQGQCTPGIEFPTQVRSIAPTADGDPLPIALSIRASPLYGTPGNDANSQSCSIIMSPSLDPAAIFAVTDLIPCVPQYGLPQIAPILAANVTYGEGIIDSYPPGSPNSPKCGFWCAALDPFNNRHLLTPLEWTIITFMFSMLFFVLTVSACVCFCQRITISRKEQLSYAETLRQRALHLRAEEAQVAGVTT